MKSTARIAGHPVHPMLIPYPFALLSTAAAFDVIDKARHRPRAGVERADHVFGRTAGHLLDAGLLSAVVAAVPGIVDYFGSVPRGTQAARHATWHAAFNSSAMSCWLRSRWFQPVSGITMKAELPVKTPIRA